MTRIVGGVAGGRRLRVPPAGTRPTSDRVREAMFSMLASRIDFDGARVLDLYAGSGALGLEALSRGAARLTLVENNGRAARVITDNISELGLAGATLRRSTVAALLDSAPDTDYDVVFADPPYDLAADRVETELRALRDGGWVCDGALVVVERSARSAEIRWPDGYLAQRVKAYGETRVELAVVAAGEPSADTV